MALPQPPMPQTATCYRHPGREAGRRCTRCGRPACTECLVQASVGSHCVECAKLDRPPVATKVRYWSARQPILVTYSIIALNIAVFIWLVIQDSSSFMSSNIGPAIRVRPRPGQDLPRRDGEWYRLISSGFLHFGIIHIAFNMLLLFQLGNLLEPAIGRLRFGLLYFAALLAGSAGALIVSPNSLSGGASGAVFGLMAAAFVGLRNRGVNPFSTGIGTVLVINLLLTFTLPGHLDRRPRRRHRRRGAGGVGDHAPPPPTGPEVGDLRDAGRRHGRLGAGVGHRREELTSTAIAARP